MTAIVGAGNRSVVYSKYALQHPDRMRIVAVADPDDVRRRGFAQRFEIPAKHCFGSADELTIYR
ncbi:MAG: hypothetical protein CMJ18_20000 [Phycisphaeraceae bacterium]|nr:hypothetical protein [Phycisphaeraceae bacterium]